MYRVYTRFLVKHSCHLLKSTHSRTRLPTHTFTVYPNCKKRCSKESGMQPSVNRQGARPSPDDLTKSSFDQKLLTSRLFRSQGQKFHPGVAGPQPRTTLSAVGVHDTDPSITTSHALPSTPAHAGPFFSHTSTHTKAPTVAGSPVLVSTTAQLRAPLPPPSAPVGVPRPLQPLLGPRYVPQRGASMIV